MFGFSANPSDRNRMGRGAELEIVRRAYAKRIMFFAGVHDRRVEAAFASVPRERFLGRGPWPILRWDRGYVPTPSRNPVYIYDDVLIGIVPERGLNNGQPSLHALLVASAAPRSGEHAVHVGTGLGYYTAILAHLVGRRGRVTAIEYDPALAAKLATSFKGEHNVRCIHGDGTRVEFDTADVIYINAGATRPADIWLDRLTDGGRLILPLTSNQGFAGSASGPIERHGAVFRVERRGEEFLATRISGVAIFPCEGGRDEASEAALRAAFEKGGSERVTRLYRRDDLPEERCWLRAPGWSLSYE
jgi:protein-L-isoaspartate(D-aspartate) O-methyltransferase